MKSEKSQILFYVPNIIGYLRVILAIIPILLDQKYYYLSIISYGISQIFDVLDGYFARLLNQETKFGAILDMITDRCSTLIMIILCIILNKKYKLIMIFCLIGDISGHWIYMNSSVMIGKDSHKSVETRMWPVLKLYYSNKLILFALHSCNELIWIILYCHGCIYKQPINKLTVFDRNVIKITSKMLLLILPLGAIKNIINYIHLLYGFNILVEIDMKEREKN